MIRFRSLSALATASALTLSLAACGSDSSEAEEGSESTTASSDAPDATDGPSTEATDGDSTDATDAAPAESAAPQEATAEAADVNFVIASSVIGPKEEVAVFAVASELGYYAEENLNVTTTNVDGSIAAVQAVGTGQGDVTASDTGSILAGVSNGVPVTAIGGLVQNWPWEMAVLPGSDISEPADLDGKKVGVISLASGSAPYARAFIGAGDLVPDQDVQLIAVGVGAQAAAALTGGDVDALALYTQAYAVIENAGTELTYLENPDIFKGIRSLSFAANAGRLGDEPDVYERFMRASYKALLFSSANPEAAMKIGYKVFPQILGGESEEARLDADVRSLEAWLKTSTPAQGEPASWSDWGAIPEQDWEKTQQYTIEAGQIDSAVPLDDVWDPGLLGGVNSFDAAAVLEQAATWTE